MPCTNPETAKLLEDYELEILSHEDRRRLENHALECDECFQSLYKQGLITELLEEGKAVGKRVLRAAGTEAPTGIAGEGKARGRLPWSGRKRVLVMAGTAAASLVLVLGIRVMMPAGGLEQTRGASEGRITTLAPSGVVARPETVRWEPVAAAGFYEVSIHTSRGRLVWRQRVDEPPAILPEEVRQTLRSGETYFWQVRASLPEGEDEESDLVPFTIRD